MLDGMSRTQLAVYAAIGIVLILLGIRAVREQPSTGSAEASEGDFTGLSSEPVGSGGPPASNGDVVVHVAGAVDEPGVYRLPAGSRVADALERAGGANGRADPNAINLAARLADGQQVVVPVRTGSVSARPTGTGTSRGGRCGSDQPRFRRPGGARDDRRHRAGHRRRHPRVQGRERRDLLDRTARRDTGDRAGHDRVPERPPPALTDRGGSR